MNRVFKICAEFLSLVLAASAFFVSCASTSGQEPKTPVVYVTNLKKINILTSDKIAKPIDEVQLFEGSFGERSFAMPLYIQADGNAINVSILNDFGTSMGELSYSDNVVEFSSSVFPEDLKAEYVIWDIQLALYKAEEIAECLSKSKLSFLVENDGETEVRKILDGKNEIEEISISRNMIMIKNYLRGYEYHLIGVGDE